MLAQTSTVPRWGRVLGLIAACANSASKAAGLRQDAF